MGIVLRKSATCILALAALLAGPSVRADQVMIDRLESGEIVSTKMGSAFVVQQVIKKRAGAVAEALFKDIRKLPSVFPNIAFVRPYTTQDGKTLLYMKLRGVRDGLGVLMEVKEGAADAFSNATALVANSAQMGLRDTKDEVDFKKDPQNQLAVDTPNEPNIPLRRKVGVGMNLLLEGPLNQVMEMPNLRLTLNLGIGGYKILKMDPADPNNEMMAETKSDFTYLVAKVSVGSQMARGELGDYRGFGEGRLSLAQSMGTDVFETLKKKLESL